MNQIPGYVLEHRLHRGAGHAVFRGRRAWDDLPVVMKCPQAGYPTPESLARLGREFELLRRLDGRGALRPISLETGDHGAALVLEDTGARPLSDLLRPGPLEATTFLDLATAMVDALAAVHGAGLIHGLICPDNILVDPDGTVRLIDLSRASEIAQAADDAALDAPAFDPAYVAPEQTGRLDRPVDQRADHYALGAVFYEMLTGRPPFTGEDALELVHAHLSRQAEPPHARNPRVPAVLSAIVLKLLAKAAEERYQSLHGLRADLETCRTALRDSGRLPATLVVGARDRRERFRLAPRLYGRDGLVGALQDHLGAARGQPSLVLVKGPAGVGKTALVRHAFRPLVAAGGTFVAGAFDAFRRNVPYAALAAAFSQLVRALLGGREQDLAAMRSGLEHALAGNGAVLIDLVPELEVLLGPQPAVPVLPPVETENRFNRAVLAFVQAAVTQHGDHHPLALFLDDLHWADRSSLHLLEYLLASGPPGLLIVGTVLDGEIDDAHPLPFTLERVRARGLPVAELEVPPLDAAAVEALLAEALGTTADSVAPLALACLDKTRGSPLFLNRFLVSLHDRGLIAYDSAANAWAWDLEAVRALDITDNVVDLMVARIRDLGPTAQRVLQRAACIGIAFDLETLSTINDIGPAATLAQLWEAVREGLVVPVGEGYRHFRTAGDAPPPAGVPARDARFRFQHERVHEAAYILLSPSERALRHLNIGCVLLDALSPDGLGDRLFEVVDQLNRGLEHARDPSLRRRIAALNLDAARRAKATAASASALALAREGMAALRGVAPEPGAEEAPADPWRSDRALTLNLHNEAAEAAYMIGDMATMEAMASAVIARARDGLEAARMWELRVLRHGMAGDNPAAVAAAVAGAAALGLRLPRRAGPLARLNGLWAMHRLARRVVEEPAHPPPPDAARRRALLHILNAAATALYAGRHDLLILVVAEILRQVEALGDPALRPFALALYASLLSALGRAPQASRAARDALAALPPPGVEKDAPLSARALYLATALGGHWHEPLRALHLRLLECRQRGERQGDMETAALAATTALQYGFYAGIDLPALRQEAEGIGRPGDPSFLPVARLVLQAIRNLERPAPAAGEAEPPDPLDLGAAAQDAGLLRSGARESLSLLKLAQSHALVLMLAVLFGRWEEARASAEVGRRHQALVRGTATGAVFCFYGALAVAQAPDGGPRRVRLRAVRRALARFRKWAALGPANARHRRLLLEALEARLTGQGLRASELYDQAIAAAQTAGFQHEQALFHDLAAEFHDALGRPMMASAYRRQAHHAYRLWGATAKVAQLEERWPELGTDGLPATSGAGAEAPAGATGQRIDLLAVMKATQAISGEIQRPALMERLLSITLATAGAQRGLLFLQGPDGWALEAEGETADGTTGDRFTLLRRRIAVGDGQATTASGPPFARSVFNLVSRTRETVVLRNAAEEGAFTSDPDVAARRPRSILCMPLIHQGELRGVLYLENNLAAGTFTATRVQILNMLASQVVISLDNARLYEDLTALNRTLERQVAERTREATEKSRLLEATLENMSDGLVAYDEDGRLLVWNDRAMRLLGSAPAGASFGERVAGTPEGGVIALDDGRFIQIRRTFMPDGGQVQVFLDVTKERQREAELISARQEAEQALSDLTATQQSLIQAEKMASLGQLVAGVAHEINTPVGITLTAASFLAERTRELTGALAGPGIRRSDLDRYVGQAAETTGLMLTNIQRAADLIQGFKQVAVDQTSGERRAFGLRAYIDEVLVSCGPMLRKTPHHVTVDCPADLEVEGYPGALSQVLTNLVVNALTHAYGPDASGTLRIKVTQPDPATVDLCFSDDGRGIPPEHRDRIFDPFFTTRRGQGGSGLGLHIVFNLVTAMMGGTVSLDPAPPAGGTVFRIRFPVVAPKGA